jgi:hypothetical protein
MSNAADRTLHIPSGVPVARFRPPPSVTVPAGQEVPLISKDAPPEKRVQEVWVVHVKAFNLSDAADADAYEKVLQKIVDNQAIEMSNSRVDFHDGRYTALLRWAEFVYKLPSV